MIYLKYFSFTSKQEEREFLYGDSSAGSPMRLHTGSFYPFEILPDIGISTLHFEPITILYGGNGSGKTTVLNVIAEKLHLKRESLFNSGRFFSDYLDMCEYNEEDFRGYSQFLNHNSRIITSDDVFNFSMKRRDFNKQLYQKTLDVTQEYYDIIHGDSNLQSLEDYERWHTRNEAIKSKSAFLKKHLEREKTEQSNGETAMMYFIERMEDEGLYLLDEPENSLSLKNQLTLSEFIASSARVARCQFIIATHSPIFLALSQAKIYDLDNGAKPVDSWTKLEGVRLLHDFFAEHEAEFR